ncbi:group II intron reverse transcriptase/maturase [Bacillus pseudomycoides]|nr:group II intron reverse transcriptase/maturase [Bacillus pseudomycoides]
MSNQLDNKHETELKHKALKKKQKLRNNEYYDTQEMFDELYALSCKGSRFKNLYNLVISENNIKLAYRNIKRNKGSKTKGTNDTTIRELAKTNIGEFVKMIQNSLANYKPQPVRRVMIPKHNGKERPLGIPTLEDRIIQQCIKQVLEPICEAKFHPYSYGFRPNRSPKHAIVRAMSIMNLQKMYYVVDIDIKGFFDNVNHSKLLKQLWTVGIRDKKIISIISKILKSEVLGEGVKDTGTPQGGIISPLLSNIVLNELDWWISSQWKDFPTRKDYTNIDSRNGSIINSHKYRALRDSSNLKELAYVRYADDFKIFCKDYETASKIFIATKKWLKNRLGLDVSNDKSKITNVMKNYTEFLGLKMKMKMKKAKKTDYVVVSHMTDKAKAKVIENYKKGIKLIAENPNSDTVRKLNSKILGYHNYYDIATRVNDDFSEIHWKTMKFLHNRLHGVAKGSSYSNRKKKIKERPKDYLERYRKYNFKEYVIMGKPIYPIAGIKNVTYKAFNSKICNYTKTGRDIIHKNQQSVNQNVVKYLMENPVRNRSVEYNDNRIALYIAQKGACGITKEGLAITDIETHHIVPFGKGGTDAYDNLIIVREIVHKLIHAIKTDTINRYLKQIGKLSKSQYKKLNKLRKFVGNEPIEVELKIA